MWFPIYSRFIAGTRLSAAVRVAKRLETKQVGSIVDYSVESSDNLSRNVDEIFKQIDTLESSFIALKFSALGIENMNACKRLIDWFWDENNKKEKPNTFLIDAEYDSIQDSIYEISNYAIDAYNRPEQKIFYKTLQMYRRDVWDHYSNDTASFMKEGKYALKLVRGAYMTLDKHVLLDSKIETDNQYNKTMLHFINQLQTHPDNSMIIATHNRDSYTLALQSIDVPNDSIYFATLLGMADDLCFDASGAKKLKYVPYGPLFETTPYLFRRLVENKSMLQYVM